MDLKSLVGGKQGFYYGTPTLACEETPHLFCVRRRLPDGLVGGAAEDQGKDRHRYRRETGLRCFRRSVSHHLMPES